ncbi:MAG: aminotransferase class I/II-fold pyridoxal phosphate-dependent enzyme [Thermoleophilaceae bacterium]
MSGGLDLPDFRLEVHFRRWEFAASHNLTASDAQTLTVGELLALDGDRERQRFEGLPLTYTPTWGGDELREAVAGTYEQIEPEHVLCFAGAEEAMFWAMQELVAPGEHAVITVPNYQSMESVPLAAGVEVDGVLLDEAADWRLHLDRLEALLRPTTRLVAVNFPNNPTGAVPDQQTFAQLAALCEEHSIRLLNDEVYRGLELDQSRTLPQAADLSPTAISMNVMSKAYGLPGLRVGWLACRDRTLLERLERRKHYTSICNAGPSELLATVALRNGERVRARNRAIIAENLSRFTALFASWDELFDWQPPQGGCVSFPRYLGPDGVEAFCRDAVEQAGVLLLPASIYASELAPVPADRFRVGIGRRGAEPALAALDGFLRDR